MIKSFFLNNTIKVKKGIENLKKTPINVNQSSNAINDTFGIDLVSEIRERKTKSRTIKIFNIDISNRDERKLAVNLIKSLKIDYNISSIIRLGKQSNKSIRITLNNIQVVMALLKSKNSYFINLL